MPDEEYALRFDAAVEAAVDAAHPVLCSGWHDVRCLLLRSKIEHALRSVYWPPAERSA